MSRKMDESELEITICKSEKTKFLGSEVGVKILHKKTGGSTLNEM